MSTNPAVQTTTRVVVGMSSDHCARSVREEVSDVPGVNDVQVDLASGRLTVTGDQVSDAAIAAAVEEAGYEISS